MSVHTTRRLRRGETACGFCLRSEPGGVWCRGACRNLSLNDLVRRIRAVHNNEVRLEAAVKGPVKAIRPHLVPCAPGDAFERAMQHRAAAVERVVGSLQRLQSSAAAMELTVHRLAVAKATLDATRRTLAAPTHPLVAHGKVTHMGG